MVLNLITWWCLGLLMLLSCSLIVLGAFGDSAEFLAVGMVSSALLVAIVNHIVNKGEKK